MNKALHGGMPSDPVCDYCANEAYDMGFAGEYAAVVNLMRELGAEMPDHLCDEIEEDGEARCGCACKATTKRKLRARVQVPAKDLESVGETLKGRVVE